mgnify:CR=1 FL=1
MIVEQSRQILEEVSKAFIGKNDIVEKVLMTIYAGGHVLLEDCPGVGKTTLALAFSKVLGLSSKRIQFTTDTLPSDITGFTVFNQQTGEFEYREGAANCQLLLADEINRTSSKTQSALLEAMEEYHVTVDGQTYPLPEPFVVLATQNPVGSAGTQLLPAAQLDRFLIRTSMGYPDAKSQIDILKERHHENPLNKLTAAVSREQLLSLMNDARQVHISDPVYAYVVDLVTATRENEFIELGVSPRGALALCRMAKSCAFVRGRDYVIPEDVAAVFDDVCCHRLVLSAKARLHRLSAADVTAEIVKTVKMPQVQEK